MSERKLWQYMDRAIGEYGHFSRVESHASSAGIPDVDFCVSGKEGHIELKYGMGKIPKIRATQARWFRNRARAKGKPWMFTHLEGSSKPPVYLLHAAPAVEILAVGAPRGDWEFLATRGWQDSVNWIEFFDLILERK